LVVESTRFPVGGYRLEGELAYPECLQPVGVVVVAGPHPLLGGNLHNNVVRTLGDGLAQQGFVTLRFNYRGVGASEGPAVNQTEQLKRFWQTARADLEPEYLADLCGAVAYLRAVAGASLPLTLVGYSFGCTLLPAAAKVGGGAAALVLVAPTLGVHDFNDYAAVTAPKLVIAPEADFATAAVNVDDWFAGLPAPKRLERPRLDSHFFRGHEDWLLATLGTCLDGQWE
jgi:hypothetical protein